MKTVNLADSKLDKQKLAKIVNDNLDCVSLDISGNALVDINSLEPLASTLQELDLTGVEVTDFSVLGKLEGLTKLTADRTQIGSSLKVLLPLKGLETLSLIEVISKEFNILSALTSLTELNLRDSSIVAADLHQIILPKLDTLVLVSTKITELSWIVNFPQLREISLVNVDIEPQDLMVLATHLFLEYIAVDRVHNLEAARESVLSTIQENKLETISSFEKINATINYVMLKFTNTISNIICSYIKGHNLFSFFNQNKKVKSDSLLSTQESHDIDVTSYDRLNGQLIYSPIFKGIK